MMYYPVWQLIGEIPSELGEMAQLVCLRLGDNRLSGSIPSTLGNLINLRELWLYRNQLTGTIPESFGQLKNIKILGLNQNRLEGTLPSSLAHLSNLNYIDISGNYQLTGLFPRFYYISKLEYLRFDFYRFHGCGVDLIERFGLHYYKHFKCQRWKVVRDFVLFIHGHNFLRIRLIDTHGHNSNALLSDENMISMRNLIDTNSQDELHHGDIIESEIPREGVYSTESFVGNSANHNRVISQVFGIEALCRHISRYL